MRRAESALTGVRALIERGAPPAEVDAQIGTAATLLDEADAVLQGGSASGTATFIGAFTILLREGLEALLVVAAMVAFLRKAERPQQLVYVHGGWVAAVIAGGLTWIAATGVISISGAERELTEGIGAMLAAVVLVSVGIWMHGTLPQGECPIQ